MRYVRIDSCSDKEKKWGQKKAFSRMTASLMVGAATAATAAAAVSCCCTRLEAT